MWIDKPGAAETKGAQSFLCAEQVFATGVHQGRYLFIAWSLLASGRLPALLLGPLGQAQEWLLEASPQVPETLEPSHQGPT